MYLYPCASGHTDERIADAGPPHTRADVLLPSARAGECACEWAPTHPRRPMRAPFRRRGPRAARLAGVLVCVGVVQREHRRVEHRVGHHVVLGMRLCFGPPARHRLRDALGESSMRRGPLCAAGPPMRARVWACGDVWARSIYNMCAYIDAKSGYVKWALVCSCIRVRSRAGADDALVCGMCASATRSPRNAIDGPRTRSVYRYTMQACLHPCASGHTDERIADAGPPHTRARVLRPSARAGECACEWAPTHPRRPMRAPFRRRGPRAARLAGVHVCVVQCGHRRVEHRVGHHVDGCMRLCFGPAASHRLRDALGGSSMMQCGPLYAAGPPNARACAWADVWAYIYICM
jgi:hypothetical protein